MSTKTNLNIRIDKELREKLNAKTKANGTNTTEVLTQFIERYVNDDVMTNNDYRNDIMTSNDNVMTEVENRLKKSLDEAIEEKLQSYQANFNQALERVYERLETVEAAPDTAKDDADTETRSLRGATPTRLDELPQRLEKLEATPANLDADLVQKDLATTTHSDEPTPPQPQPPVLPRKTDSSPSEDLGGDEAAPDVYTYEQLEAQFPLKRSTLESAKSRAKKEAKEEGKEWNGILESKGYKLQYVSEGRQGIKIRVLDVPEIAKYPTT